MSRKENYVPILVLNEKQNKLNTVSVSEYICKTVELYDRKFNVKQKENQKYMIMKEYQLTFENKRAHCVSFCPHYDNTPMQYTAIFHGCKL